MCGILAALGVVGDPDATRATVVRQARLLRHRGPDASSVWQSAGAGGGPHNFIAFERLQIIDTSDAGR
jgi:asparagine synthetase B (glutamine-hydrolysing)